MTDSALYRLHPQWDSIDAILAAHPEGLSIDLGCGFVKPEGFVGLDDLSGITAQIPDDANAPDVYMNLNADPLPFPDASVVEVRASHFLEHSHLDHVITETHRVLRPGGTFLFVVPYANSAEGMFPGHNIFLTERFFELNMTFQDRFEIVKTEFFPTQIWHDLPWVVRRLLPFDVARKVLFNVCHQMAIWATPRERPPGA